MKTNNINGKVAYKKTNNSLQIKKMTITAIFLTLATLTSFGTNFIKISFLADFLSLDISLIFIIPLIFICSYYWAALAAVIMSLFTFLWPGNIWIGVVFNIIVNFTFVTLIWFFNKIVSNKLKGTRNVFLILNFVISTIIASLFFTFLNGILFQPLYWWFFKLSSTLSFIDVAKLYNFGIISNVWLLWIPDYWSGIFALYISFNLFKFVIISIIVIPLIMLLYKNNFIRNNYEIKSTTY